MTSSTYMVDLYSNRKASIVVAPYTFPDDFEHPDCEMCGSPPGSANRRLLIPNAKETPCSLVECLGCGLRFFSPRPKWSIVAPLVAAEEVQAQRLFDWGSFTPVPDPVVQKANIQSYYRKMLADCAEVLGHVPATMFEVGGLVGWFAKAARDFGVGWIDGCDLNPTGVALARQNGAIFTACDFADYVPTLQYEFVVGLDVLEHVYNPRATLEKMAAMIEPGGVFLAKTFLDELDIHHEQLAPPTHSIHWTTPVLRGAIERVGLTIKQWRLCYPLENPYMPIVIAQKPST